MATFSLFKINEFGEQTYLDVVQDAVKFEIEKTVEQQKINTWKYNVYGAVMLPSIRWIEK